MFDSRNTKMSGCTKSNLHSSVGIIFIKRFIIFQFLNNIFKNILFLINLHFRCELFSIFIPRAFRRIKHITVYLTISTSRLNLEMFDCRLRHFKLNTQMFFPYGFKADYFYAIYLSCLPVKVKAAFLLLLRALL